MSAADTGNTANVIFECSRETKASAGNAVEAIKDNRNTVDTGITKDVIFEYSKDLKGNIANTKNQHRRTL